MELHDADVEAQMERMNKDYREGWYYEKPKYSGHLYHPELDRAYRVPYDDPRLNTDLELRDPGFDKSDPFYSREYFRRDGPTPKSNRRLNKDLQ